VADTDGTIASRVWTVTPSTGFTGTLTGTGGSLTFTAPGTYTIGLTATDDDGATATANRTINVVAPTEANILPTPSFIAPSNAMLDFPVVITCVSLDVDGTIASRAWTITPSIGFIGSLANAGGILTFTAPGSYTVRLTVTDNRGGTQTVSRLINVANVSPIAAITLGATAPALNSSVNIACASTDADGTITGRAWTITPNTGFVGSLSSTGGALSFTIPGSYTIQLRVTDNSGRSSIVSRMLTVSGADPVALINLPTTATIGTPVVIQCVSTNAIGTIVERTWTVTPITSFTGTLTGTGGILTFTTARSYTIRLRVVNSNGRSNVISRTINVR